MSSPFSKAALVLSVVLLLLSSAGICLAEDARRAEQVGRACVDVCTPDSKDIIESLIEGYVTGACEPPDYEYSSTPTGGGSVSPST